MKVKNIMFFGFAAAILSAGAASAAPSYTEVTVNDAARKIVASKSYVDAQGNKLNSDISLKQDILIAGDNITIGADGKTISATDTTYDTFTTSANGLVPMADGTGETGMFLRGDGTWATPENTTYTAGNNIEITNGEISATYTAGDNIEITNGEISATYTAGDNVQINNGVISATDTTYNVMQGTNGSSAGASGLVPAQATTDAGKFLKADGTWATPENTTYNTLDAATIRTGTDTEAKLVTAAVLDDVLDDKQNLISGATDGDITTTNAAGQTQDSGKTFDTANGTITPDSTTAIPSSAQVAGYVQSVTNGNTIPTMPSQCGTTGYSCALVTNSSGNLQWVVMATDQHGGSETPTNNQ